jgi:hypothetical protein
MAHLDSFASHTYEKCLCRVAYDTSCVTSFSPLRPQYHNLVPFASSPGLVGVANHGGILFHMHLLMFAVSLNTILFMALF